MASTLERKSPQLETATSRFFAYLRVSEADSYDDSLVPQHEQRCREYFESLQASGARLKWGEFVVERDVTCFDTTLKGRRQGELLHRTLGAGDVVVFPDILRSFRDSEDLRWTWKLWQDRGATLKFLDLDAQFDGTEGKMLGNALDAFGVLDRYVHTERVRAGLQSKLRRGLVAGKAAPLGNAKVRAKRGVLSVPSRQDRTVMRTIWMMRQYWGRTRREIVELIEAKLAARENRPVVHFVNHPKWSDKRVSETIKRLAVLDAEARAAFWRGEMQRLEPKR